MSQPASSEPDLTARASPIPPESTIGAYRWRICALLFFATTINYLDRSILGVLGPTLRDHVFHWTNEQYSWIAISFQAAYALGLMLMGIVMDKVGVRRGFVISIGIWSFFGLLHAAIRPAFGLVGFIVARFGLGVGESGNFPACIKTVAEWFPKKERALAAGIFNAGSNVGAILAPLIIPAIVGVDGHHWQFAFLITAGFSALWIFCWLSVYRPPQSHPRLSSAELHYIRSDNSAESAEKISWRRLLPVKETWAFAVGKLTDAVWWFYLFWGSFFFADKFHLNIKQLGLPLVIVYVGADLGSIAGGWLSGAFLRLGWSLNKARKVTLLICALAVLPVAFAGYTTNQWAAVCLIALAAGAHQAWSANLFTLVSDVFPRKATASVVGIGGLVGSGVSLIANVSLGETLKAGDASGYAIPFAVAGTLYLVVLLAVHCITPHLTPLGEDLRPVHKEKRG
ncbi:MAG TPA: MFS transporter [Verrucomicrobiae bacterium]|nr:MFS transporter [Verrucomicrobiae bacterium]